VTAPLVTGAPRFGSHRFTEPDEVRAFYADEYTACAGLGEPEPGRPFAASADHLRLGPLEVNEHRYSVDLAVRISREDLYVISRTWSGSLFMRQRDDEVTGTATKAAVYRPGAGPAVFQMGATEAPSRVDGLVIDSRVLARVLEQMLDRPVPATIALAPTVDLAGAAGRSWLQLLRLFGDTIRSQDPALLQPMVAEPLCEALISGLLLISEHPYSEALHRPVATARPRHVRVVIDVLHASPELPHSATSLARLAAVSVRSLQEGFRLHVGVPPMTYLREIRLARAHEDLSSGQARTVADAAHRWGFVHLGRFAAAYHAKYGILPSAARSGPGVSPTRRPV
jgi:AraC-like DNA-binding protein